MFSLPSRQLPSQPLPGSQHEQGRGSPALSTRPEADSVLQTSDTLWGLVLGQGWGEDEQEKHGARRGGGGGEGGGSTTSFGCCLVPPLKPLDCLPLHPFLAQTSSRSKQIRNT